ncbi:MAG TPA: NUDIX hydrolase [Bradyrhizobium sp.]
MISLNRVIDESLEKRLGDRACSVQLSQPERLGNGFRNYDRYSVMRRDRVGEVVSFHREVLRSGAVVGVLPIDFERQEIVLTRQFRLGGHLAANRGEMVEIVAGRVDGDEQPEEAARRECLEETGAQPLQLRRLFDFAPAPALSDEFMTLFLAVVDASQTSIWAGMPHENEEIAVARYSFAEAIALVDDGLLHSGPTIVALQWFARNSGSLQRQP